MQRPNVAMVRIGSMPIRTTQGVSNRGRHASLWQDGSGRSTEHILRAARMDTARSVLRPGSLPAPFAPLAEGCKNSQGYPVLFELVTQIASPQN